jgi:hypothetical protein
MPGSQSGVAHAIAEAALSHGPPRRLLLNSDAYEAVTTALRERLAALEASARARTRPTPSTRRAHFPPVNAPAATVLRVTVITTPGQITRMKGGDRRSRITRRAITFTGVEPVHSKGART